MPTLTPISRDTHGDKRWRRPKDYKFVASDAVAPLVIKELPRAALSLPIGFIVQGNGFMPVAVLGLAPGQNLLVAPDGRWVGTYVPAVFRSYPFVLAQADDGREVLCTLEDDGCVSEDPDGQPFFGEDGEASGPTAELVAFLQNVSASRKATQRVCAVLKEYGLIQPWPIVVKVPSGDQKVEGLHAIDEQALNALPADAFLKVREAGGLPVAYCQLLSMPHLTALGRLAAARTEAAARKLPVNEAGELDLEFLNDGPLINFQKFR